ncbi:MAG: phosphate ABC transporter permease subunit PstC [Desulfobulbaceae bacterium A2]|nr:MAG: phosphate ABC transporter permease subunit PstC [Desulfobulbaceae bacterium A2]
MTTFWLLILMTVLGIVAYRAGRGRSLAVAGPGGARTLHSLPGYYGILTVLWCLLPVLVIFAGWHLMENTLLMWQVVGQLPPELRDLPPEQLNLRLNDLRNFIDGNIVSGTIDPALKVGADHFIQLRSTARNGLAVAVLGLGFALLLWGRQRIRPDLRARNLVERIAVVGLICCASIAILTTIGIVLSVLFEAIRFFKHVPPLNFLFGLEWSPQMAIRADQVGSSGAFGAVPVFAGTLLISTIAMLVAVPLGLLSAVYLSEYADRRARALIKPLMEILAGIPTVVYGFFAALVVAPMVRGAGASLGLDVASESALAAGLVMGIMIIPFVSSLSDDVINAVPQAMRDGSYALGATKNETIRLVIIPAALPGIVGGVLLAVSRAIGETMIVVMAAGLSANLTANPLQAVTTVTVQIVTLLVGDQEFDSPKTLAAFALGLVLFLATLCINIVALYVVRKYREQYE